jgi:K+-sensing histidine kinase KdpD
MAADELTAALGRVVHDLRSPLQTMFSTIDELDSRVLEPEGKRGVQRLRRSVESMDRHLGDLAMLLLVQSGSLRERPVSFEVGALLEEVGDLSERAGQAVLILKPRGPIFVFADAVLIRQMLVRLTCVLSKMASQGSVSVSVDDAEAGTATVLRFRVRCAMREAEHQVSTMLLPVKLIARALGGELDDGKDGCYALTVPACLEDPDAKPASRV